jgi:hypothetical protein
MTRIIFALLSALLAVATFAPTLRAQNGCECLMPTLSMRAAQSKAILFGYYDK